MTRKILVLMGLAVLSAAVTLAAERQESDSAIVRWQSLSYRVSKFGLSATSEIGLVAQPSQETAKAVIDLGADQALVEPEGELLLLTMETRAFHRRSSLSLWIDATRAAALQRIQFETGGRLKRNRYKVLRFADTGVHGVLRRPTEQEVDGPPETWSRVDESFVGYPDGCCAVVGTPSLLFYLLSVADLNRVGDRIEAHLLSKGRLFLVELTVARPATIHAHYLLDSAEGSKEVEGAVEALELSMNGRAVGGEPAERGFEFLGLRGDVRVFLDRNLRVPLQISGSMKYVGRAHVKLRRVKLR